MATRDYKITGPDGRTLTISGPDDATPEQLRAAAERAFSAVAQPEAPKSRGVAGAVGDVLAGAVRGAGSIGATLLAPVDVARDLAAGRGLSLESNRERRKAMDQALGTLGADTDSLAYGGGKLAAEIAGTLGVGGGLANVAGRAVPGMAGSRAVPLLEAIRTAGMNAGGVTGRAGLGLRATGGAVTGGASATLVNPDDALTGAVVGAAMPGAIQAAGVAGRKVASGVRNVTRPEARYVDILTNVAGQDSPQALRQAIMQAGAKALPADALQSPNLARLVAEDALTVPQLLEDPGISQLQRTLQAGGARQFADTAAVQNRARMDALNRISPVSSSVQQAAENVGAEVASTVPAQRAADKAAVTRLYDGVDPFNESAVLLPVDEIRGAVGKFLGPGTFGTGARARDAVRAAQEIGEVVVPATASQRAGQAPMTLAQAVRAAGGINTNSTTSRQFAGELTDLGQKVKGITNKSGGVSLERMAEKMREAGFITSDDPAALIDDLFSNPNTVSLADVDALAARGAAKAAGEAGQQADLVLPRVSNFNEVQSFRSSLSEAADQALNKGDRKEYGALVAMLKSVDKRVDDIAAGKATGEEFFAPDMVKAWRQANEAHAKYMGRYETGPQARLWRSGGDGQPAMQGAEVAGAFYGPSRAQVENVQAFRRLVDDAEAPVNALRNYAITDAARSVGRLGDVTNSKFNNWLAARTGANRELFSQVDNAVLNQLGENLRRSDMGAYLGMAPGSNTAQNINAALDLGILDSQALQVGASKLPFVGSFMNGALASMRANAKAERVNQLADLLVDPARLLGAIDGMTPAPSRATLAAERLAYLLNPQGQSVPLGQMAQQNALRVAPLLAADR